MQKIVLVRHAAATGQDANAPLTTAGQRHAVALADLLLQVQIQRVISSPLVRATETVGPFCRRAGIGIETDDRLAERVLSARNLPDWREHLRRSFDDLDYRLADGESSRSAQARGTSAVRAALGSGHHCVLVTHGNLLALILKQVDAEIGFDFWSQLSNPDAFVLDVEHGRPRAFSRIWDPPASHSHGPEAAESRSCALRGAVPSGSVDADEEWRYASVFGDAPTEGAAVPRPSAYGLIVDESARLAVVRTPQGHFLPGGGIEPGEQPIQAIIREADEECGLQVEVGSWGLRAIDFVYSEVERRRFEKRSIFFEARSTGCDSRGESDHELLWLTADEAIGHLKHPSHQWAVTVWAAAHRAGDLATREPNVDPTDE